MNELKLENSPYLLQHANNPVHWKAWNENSLKKARDENKLIILSIGYSSCHWCHVMEHESFEDNEVAEVMNKGFISIKIDREERPDIDAIYMKAVQLMTGQGGWPLNVVLLPDARPIWGGTYFRKSIWVDSLLQLQEVYSSNPEKVEEYAEKLFHGIEAVGLVPLTKENDIPAVENLQPIINKWSKSFDYEYGGYARAPKFMMPNNYLFLQRYGYQYKIKHLLDFVDLTLTKMAYGGLFDTIDGGFSRYSVDMKWHVPHFEKMLYDNGQLMSLYAEAYKRTKNNLYKEVIEKTLRFVDKELKHESGAFFSALDADSINEENHHEEGAFYVWKGTELQKLLGNDFELFSKVYNINEFGHWENGNFVLIQSQNLSDIAKEEKISEAELNSKKTDWEKILYNERQKRPKPHLDDKIITSWNALMLKGYIDCYKALNIQGYLETALKNASFIVKNLWHTEGHLWRTYKNGETKIKGFLEDYALVADAFISLHQVTLDEKWLVYSKQLMDYCLDHFYNPARKFFVFNADEELITHHYETEDNVISASNSVIAKVLYKLSIFFDNHHYEKTALQMLQNIIPNIDYPSAFSNWMDLWMDISTQNKELAVCGKNAQKEILKINELYLPNIIIGGSTKPSSIPFLKNRFAENSLMIYVCKNKACGLPRNSVDEIIKEISTL